MINEVLKGITDALYAAFGDDYEIHTEASMQDMEEPAFFVRCINPDVPRGLTGRRKATLLFIVQYFPESDEPKKEINTVYERLSECLDLIEVEGKMVRGTIECKVGAKFQAVLYNCAADYEGVINVKNSPDVIPWVVGLEAACGVNATCTNAIYDGELEIDTAYTQTQLENAVKAGEFVLHSVGTEVRVLEDINSLVTLTEDKNELFQSNQTIRVLDQIAMDIASLFNTKYHGKVQNNESGRVSLWNDIASHHKQLEQLGAIENFSENDVVVSAGSEKRGVYVEDKVTIVNAMSQLYMTVVIE